jgi:hypothetical protein
MTEFPLAIPLLRVTHALQSPGQRRSANSINKIKRLRRRTGQTSAAFA